MSIALLFSGQGAQFSGMGQDLYHGNAAARAVFEQAGDEITRMCFEGSEQQLADTVNTQPCVYTVAMAAFAALNTELESLQVGVAMAAGHSLGEYAALTAAGVFDFSAGLKLVQKRASFMSEYAAGGMCACIGDPLLVAELTKKAKKNDMLLPVNFNAPAQTVIAGDLPALERFNALAEDTSIRVVPLKVGGAFHSPLMNGAADKLLQEIQPMCFGALCIPVYSNVTGQPFGDTTLKTQLALQTKSPVQWVTTIQNMIGSGADTFIEVGVGNVLSGLTRKIDRSVRSFTVNSAESLDKTITALKE